MPKSQVLSEHAVLELNSHFWNCKRFEATKQNASTRSNISTTLGLFYTPLMLNYHTELTRSNSIKNTDINYWLAHLKGYTQVRAIRLQSWSPGRTSDRLWQCNVIFWQKLLFWTQWKQTLPNVKRQSFAWIELDDVTLVVMTWSLWTCRKAPWTTPSTPRALADLELLMQSVNFHGFGAHAAESLIINGANVSAGSR